MLINGLAVNNYLICSVYVNLNTFGILYTKNQTNKDAYLKAAVILSFSLHTL